MALTMQQIMAVMNEAAIEHAKKQMTTDTFYEYMLRNGVRSTPIKYEVVEDVYEDVIDDGS